MAQEEHPPSEPRGGLEGLKGKRPGQGGERSVRDRQVSGGRG